MAGKEIDSRAPDRRGRALPLLVIGALFTCVTHSPCAADGEIAIQKLRYEEDYSSLAGAPRASTWPERWKYIPLGTEPGHFLSVGGEVRQRYEYTRDPLFGEDPQDKRGVWLQRYSLHGDWHLNPNLRLFGQLTSALANGRAEGPGPVDEDELAVQNAFVDLGFNPAANTRAVLRAGRQEILLGSGRLVDVREGPNVRRTFDGARGIAQTTRWRINALAARPRLDRPGVFDDKTNSEQGLWGIYAVSDEGVLPRGRMDIYYLGYENEDAVFVAGSGRELRQSLGTRLHGERGNWRWNWEALYQFGNFAGGNIAAWTLATETSYSWPGVCWQPDLRLSINVASGDGDLNDDTLGTFNPLYPRGNYFSEAAVLGPRNFYNFHPFLTVQPSSRWSLTADLNFFWRLRTEDGLYSPSGQIIREPDDSDAHFVGRALSLTAEYAFSPRLLFTAIYTHFYPGAFIRETGPDDDIDFTELTLLYRF